MSAAILEKIGTSGAARLLGLSEQRVRQLAAAGQLPYEETPLGRLYAVDDVHRLIAQREAAQRDRTRTRQVRPPRL